MGKPEDLLKAATVKDVVFSVVALLAAAWVLAFVVTSGVRAGIVLTNWVLSALPNL